MEVFAAITLVVELPVALLSIGVLTRRLFDQSCLRSKVKSPRRERWNVNKTARIGIRRDTIVTVTIRRPKDM